MRSPVEFFLCLLALLCLAGLSRAATDTDIDSRLEALASELRCVVCQNQSLAESDAPLAQDLKREMRQMLDSGASDTEVVDFFVERYGDFVRYRPVVKATTAPLWLAPVGVLLAAAGFVARRVRRAPAVAADGSAAAAPAAGHAASTVLVAVALMTLVIGAFWWARHDRSAAPEIAVAQPAVPSVAVTDEPAMPPSAAPAAPAGAKVLPTVDVMAERLEKRLQTQGGSPKDWMLLARSYDYMGQPEKAEAARQRAGVADASSDAPASTPAPAPTSAPPLALSGTVRIEQELSGQLPANATLFIYLRSTDGARMPLAARSYRNPVFPLAFELGEAERLDRSRAIPPPDGLVLGARLSTSGDAIAKPGDLEAAPMPVAAGGGEHVLTIDRAIVASRAQAKALP